MTFLTWEHFIVTPTQRLVRIHMSLFSCFAPFVVILGFVLLGTIAAVLQRMWRRRHTIAVAVAALFDADGTVIGAFQIRDDDNGAGREPAPYIAGADLLDLIRSLGLQSPGWSFFTGFLVPGSTPATWVDLTADCPAFHVSTAAMTKAAWLKNYTAATSKDLVAAVRTGLARVDFTVVNTCKVINGLQDGTYVLGSNGTLRPWVVDDDKNMCRHFACGVKACTAGAYCPMRHIVHIKGGDVYLA